MLYSGNWVLPHLQMGVAVIGFFQDFRYGLHSSAIPLTDLEGLPPKILKNGLYRVSGPNLSHFLVKLEYCRPSEI